MWDSQWAQRGFDDISNKPRTHTQKTQDVQKHNEDVNKIQNTHFAL